MKIKRNLQLSLISSLVISILCCQFAYADTANNAQNNNAAVDSDKIITLKNGSKVREMINDKQRSLYQIALLSSISISELKEINSHRFDNKDTIDIGDFLVLPENSPLLPPIGSNATTKTGKYVNLPNISSDDDFDEKSVSNKDSLDSSVASVLQTLATQDWKAITSKDNGGISGHIKNRSKDLAEDYIRVGVNNQFIDPIKTAAQDFLGRFGTAQLQFDVSDKGSFDNLNLKLFSPLYDSESTLIFSQISYQTYEHNRRIGNIGLGQRWEVADNKWLLGYNVFFDHDFQRNHNRLGIGAEAWSDYMKFAVNFYQPLSDWKKSKDFDDYLERAARGFDIRFQGYLPQYPHLGASLMYEKYYGDEVGLFGKDNLQKDPQALTIGLDYTPVPLFTLKAEHKRGQDNNKTTKAELTLNYRIGMPLKDQLDPSMVQNARSIKGSRYDLVDRNNNIVLEYKQQKMSIDLGLESLKLIEGHTYPFAISMHNAKGLSMIEWTGSLNEIDENNGFVCSTIDVCTASSWRTPVNNINDWKILAPNYSDDDGIHQPIATNGFYTLSIKATDNKGKSATSNPVTFEVIPDPDKRKLIAYSVDQRGTITTTINKMSADGEMSVTLLGSLMKPKDTVITGLENFEGLHDEEVFNKFIANFENIEKNWKATSNGKKIKFVDRTNLTKDALPVCPDNDPCIYIKSIEHVKKGGTISDKSATAHGMKAEGDSFTVDIASNFNGHVEFSLNLEPYGESITKVGVNFTNGFPSLVKVFRMDGVLVAEKQGNNLIFDPAGPNEWRVDQEYFVKAYAADGKTEIEDPFIIWSLVDNNGVACPDAISPTLPSFIEVPNGPWFNVEMGINAHYKIRRNDTSYASKGESITGFGFKGVNKGIKLDPITIAPVCAGDQGFKLQVSVE